MKRNPYAKLLRENEELRERLREAEETLNAIRSGEVDALLVTSLEGQQVFTLRGADYPYRVVVEQMNEGTLTLSRQGVILYANKRFAEMLGMRLEKVLGSTLRQYVVPQDRAVLSTLLKQGAVGESRRLELRLQAAKGTTVPVQLAVARLQKDQEAMLCVVATDLTEQHRNAEIAASERLARSILEQAGAAIIVCDGRGRIIRASRAAHSLAGCNLLQHSFKNVFPLTLENGKPFPVTPMLDGTIFRGVEVSLKRPGHQPQSLLLNAGPLQPGDERYRGCIVTLTDLTDYKKVEDKARQHQEWLRVTLNSIGDAVIASDVSGRIQFLNPVAAALTGWSNQEAYGQRVSSVFNIVDNDSGEGDGDLFERVVREKRVLSISGNTILLTKDRRMVPIEDSAAPITNADGKVIGAVIVFHDVTQRRKAQDALLESEERHQLATSVANEAIWELDLEKDELKWNRAYAQLFGIPASRQAEDWLSLVHPDDRLRVEATFQESLRGGPNLWVCEYRMKMANGVYAFIVDRAIIVRDLSNLAIRVVGAKLNVTDQKLSEAALLEKQSRLELALEAAQAAAHAKDQFMATVSHELRTPMTPVLMTADMLLHDETVPRELLPHLERIRRNIQIESRLVTDLLEYARATNPKLQLKLERTDLHEVVSRAIDVCAADPAARERSIRIKLKARHHFIHGDAARLQQVFWNLIQNALKFTPPGGKIVIASKDVRNGFVQITVADTGCGIERENLPRIFEAFEQVGKSRDGGLGLGLAVAKKIVEAHGGCISADSEGTDRGSIFTVELEDRGPNESRRQRK